MADKGRGGKTASGNGQAWSSPSPRGQWRTGKNGGNWLRNHLWCPIDPRDQLLPHNIIISKGRPGILVNNFRSTRKLMAGLNEPSP